MAEAVKKQRGGKFRLLVGGHSDGVKDYDARGGNNIVVDPDRDLVKLFGGDKFERLDENFPVPEYIEPVDEDDEDEPLGSPTLGDKTLEKMNLAELKAFAEEKEIDLGPAETKREIIGVIKETLMG